ncbi:MAG TPA: hypothetical protein VH012_06530 [Acidimicrobiales bacterium]|nr:hypothetical protein [Acidimicrobiales bacterium]
MEPSDGDIAAMTDPVLRNLCITQRYSEFAIALRDAGHGPDATWCAFAVWASKTAGATIRGDVLPARAKELLRDGDDTSAALGRFNSGLAGKAMQHLTHDHLGQLVEGVTADVSGHIAAGNVLVFEELAPIFTALLDACRSKPITPATLDAAITPALKSLGTDPDAASAATAFSSYGQALCAPAERAALVLQANILAVAHEQRRLQPAISGALDAAIRDTLEELIQNEIIRHLPTEGARHALTALTEDVCQVLDEAWDTALTESIMQLITASETFDLRNDIPPLAGNMFPSGLRTLAGTVAEDAFSLWDKTEGTGAPSGADDWAVLEQRMNFIVNLFRSRQNDSTLFEPPFSDVQLAALAQGQLPPGPL